MTTREIVLDGGSPWGFRMHGGADVGQPLRISRVNPGSKAAQKGIREGDVISSINGQPTRGISNSDAHALLRNAGQTLHLGLNEECGGSPKRRAHRSSLQQQQEVTKHSSQQSTSRFPGSVNGGTDQNYNTVPSRGKDDASTEGVSSSESKGRRRQKQSAATQHSLAPPLQEESPGSSAVSSDVKEEPAASSSKPKKRKRNRKKNRAQQKIASAAAENGNASQTTASTDVSDVIQQTSSREEVDTSEFLEPSADGNISQSSTVVETPSRKVQEIDTSRSLEPSKDGILENISQSSAVSETNTAEQKSPQKDINISQSTEHLTSFTPTSSEIELMQQKSSEDVEELNTPKSSSSTAVGSSENILEENSLMSEIDVVRQTSSAVQSESIVSSSLTVSMKLEVHPESQLNSVSSETITQTNTSHQGSVNSGTEAHKICNESNDTNEQKGNHSDIVHQGVIGQDNSENSEETIPKKILDNISFVSPEKNIKGNNAHEAGITRNNTHVTANVHNAVFSQEELNAQRKQSNSVQEGEENSRESPKRDSEVAMLSNSVTKQEQATDKITGDSQRLSKTAVQVKSCQSSVECRAVVVETVDEEVWEEAVEFSIEGTHDPGTESCPLTSNTVSLQQYELTLEDEELLDPKPVIAAEEEETLRNFLYSLNLADYGRDSPRRGKRRSSHEVACNPVLHQRGLEVIMEENSSEISDSGDSKRGKGWKEAIYIPDTNEVIYLNEDSADEGEYTTEEASSKTESAMRSMYYAETTTTLTTEGTSSAEMREFIYRTVGETVKDDEDVFSAHMERMLEADAENGPQIIELVSEGEEDKEDVVSTQKTEEKQSGVEVVFVEDDTTSTSSGAPTNWEDVEDAPYEDVMFPVQGQPKYTHRREDSIYENMDINYERFPESEDDTVYENVDFTKRDAQDQGSFSTSSSEPRVSSRHLNCLVPPEQETSVRESPKEVQQDSDKRRDACNSSRQLTSSVPLEQEPSKGESLKQVKQGSDKQHTPSNSEPEVASRHLTSSVPLEQEPSKGESLKQVKQGSDKQHTPSNSEPEVASRHLTSSVPLEQDPSKGESPKKMQHEPDKQRIPSNFEPEVSSHNLDCMIAETTVVELMEQVQHANLSTSKPEPEISAQNQKCLIPETREFMGEFLQQGQDDIHHAGVSANIFKPQVSNLGQNCLVPPTVSEEETDMTVARSANEAELSNGLKNYAIPPIVLGRDISDNMVESNNHELEGQDAIEDGRDSITPTNNLSRRGSSSSDDTASHGTAFYCPVDAHSPALSSDADISSLTEEVPEARRKKVQSTPKSLKNPLSLKELCVAKVVTMPYGTYILNILGVRPHATPVRELSQLPERDTPVPCDEQWLATPTLDDPNLLVCLSPSQRKVYNEEVPSPDEMQTLLDLHCKFLQRRGYHEKPPPLPPSRKYRPLTSPRGVTKISPTSRSSSRLLAILREASEQEKVKPPPLPPPPDMSSCCKTTPPAERLKVRSLSDWLQLVRCAGGEANENTNGARSKDSTPPILSTQSSPGVVRRSSQLSSNHLVRCVDVGVNDKRNEARSKDSTPTILSTQSSPGTVRRSVPSQSENELLWYVDCSVNENLTDPTSPILSTQSSPGAFRRSVSCQRSFSEPEEEHVPQVPVRGQENYVRRSLLEPEEGHLPQAPFKGQENNLRHSLVFPEEKHRPSVVVQSQENHLRRSLLETEEEHVPSVPVRAEENRRFDPDNYRISKRGDIAIINSRPQQEDRSLRPRSLPPPSEALVTGGEIFRQQMYLEYMHKVAERSERRRQRVIRLSSVPKEDDMAATESAGGPLENEFMDKVRERMDKLGIRYDVEDGEAGRQNGVGDLPKHLQEFLALTDSPEDVTGVWSPSQKSCSEQDQAVQLKEKVGEGADDAPPVVWTPKSAGASPTTERKEFRPIKFESPTLSRKNRSGTSTPAPKTSDGSCSEVDSISTGTTTAGTTFSSTFQPWQTRDDSTLISSEQRVTSSSSTTDRRLVQSQSAPASGLSSLAASTKLPRAQNPTITLLQKAREGQLPKGALYLDHRMNSKEGENAYISPNEILYSVKKEYDSEGQNSQHKKIVELTPRKFEGIGPTTVEGVPTVLRSEIKDANQAKWYKRMYDSLHRAGKDDDYITIRYKTRKGQYPYTSPGGYLSEPEPACYDSDIGFSAKYATLDRRRIKNKENDFTTSTLPRSRYVPHPSSIKYATQVYKNQPGRIEDYEPGRSSISEKETKQWWDEVLDIFDGWLESYSPHHPTYRSSSQLTTKADATMYQQRASVEQQTNQSAPNKTFMAHALKDGYESDSTLVFKRRDENLQSQISPAEQKQAYKTIQKGGEVPLHGLRKPAPERPKESPHRYVESEVTIHYRSPVRSEAKEALSEEELARRQAEAMRRIYQEERRRKYLQELQDMHSRRHTDNFTPSQKSPIPLNRYDDFFDDVGNKSKSRDRTPEPKLVARALYNFVGQTSRELSFRRGDIIFVRRQIDKNWYEGEHNAMVGLFPFNYVEIIPYDGIRTIPKRPTEGQARAKFNFIAQTHLELSLVKGELVVLTRRVDDNWFEGRIGNRKGIFPVSYIEVLQEPGEKPVTSTAPPSKPASHTTLVNGTGIKQSMGSHSYQPSFYYSHNKTSSPYTSTNPYATLPRQSQLSKQSLAPVNQTLHIDTHSEPVPYRALYNYRPQNEDELELCEGDTVYVMEKCDDGWYVGSSQRTGYFGTFPGNYVERI